jgi:hypothetical protein
MTSSFSHFIVSIQRNYIQLQSQLGESVPGDRDGVLVCFARGTCNWILLYIKWLGVLVDTPCIVCWKCSRHFANLGMTFTRNTYRAPLLVVRTTEHNIY